MTAADEPRQHGLQPPLDTFQYIALFAYVLFAASFGVLHAPLLTPGVWSYVVISVFCVWIPLSVISYVVAAVSECHPDELDDEPPIPYGELIRMTAPPGKKDCRECLIMVPESCKHCHACGKCVIGFDHHCRWLNHCVGEKNYAQFAVFVGNTFTLLALQAALGWWLSIETATDWDVFQYRTLRAFKIESASKATALAFFMWFIAVLELVVVLVLGQLYFLHIELNFRGISTWDLILIKRRDSRVRKAERAALGIPTAESGADTPMCHSLLVWQRKRELASLDSNQTAETSRLKYTTGQHASAFETVPPEEAEMSERAETEPSLNASQASDQRSNRSSVTSSPGLKNSTGQPTSTPQFGRRHSSAFPPTATVAPNQNEQVQEMLVPTLIRQGSSPQSSMMSPEGSGLPSGSRPPARGQETAYSSRSTSDVDDTDSRREPRPSRANPQAMDV